MLHKRTLSLCESWGGGHLNMLWDNCVTVFWIRNERWFYFTLKIKREYIHFSAEIWKNEIKYLNDCNFWTNENCLIKFSAIMEKSFLCKYWKFGGKVSIGCRELAFCLVGHFSLSHPVILIANRLAAAEANSNRLAKRVC